MADNTTEKTRQEGVVVPTVTIKPYYNCRPLIDVASGLPIIYGGKDVGFEVHNAGNKPIELALEKLNIDCIGLGEPDLDTVRCVKAHEIVTLWLGEDCAVPNTRCDGSEGREILLLNYDETSDPQYYNFTGKYIPAVCCVEDDEECEDDCMEEGECYTCSCDEDDCGTECETDECNNEEEDKCKE